jgi:predicted patatin/cPLA2 family phospholipase
MIDLTYKKYTNKDYLVDEINNKIKSYTIDRKNFKKDLRKLKVNTLLELLSNLNK